MHSSPKQPLIGVIDIGSNSVRLVVYDGLQRVPRILFNEKQYCRLGRGIEETGKLNAQAKECARKAIARFSYIADKMKISELIAVATSAVRDAEDGNEFANQIRNNFGVDINIISGKREAELAALGVMSSISDVNGIAGDLGGGSLELVEFGEIKNNCNTLPIGALRLIDKVGYDVEGIRNIIKNELEDISFDSAKNNNNFYAIGGGFRSIAKIMMHMTNYPLRIIHNYELQADELYKALNYLINIPKSDWKNIKGLSEKRHISFLPSAIILQEILSKSKCNKVIFSQSGIREGLLFEKISNDQRNTNVVLASFHNLFQKRQYDSEYSTALESWIKEGIPFIVKSKEQQKILGALCSISDIALPVISSFQGVWAFDHLMRSNIWGVSHKERIILSLALHHRYKNSWAYDNMPAISLINKEDMLWAKIVGQLCEYAFEVSGGITEIIRKTKLKYKNYKNIEIEYENDISEIIALGDSEKLKNISLLLSAFKEQDQARSEK